MPSIPKLSVIWPNIHVHLQDHILIITEINYSIKVPLGRSYNLSVTTPLLSSQAATAMGMSVKHVRVNIADDLFFSHGNHLDYCRCCAQVGRNLVDSTLYSYK